MRSNKYFLLGVLTFIGILNFVDRQIIAILLESIKADLQLSDLQLGLLSGTLFAIFYSMIGIPVARLSDRWHRGKIISIALFIWSAMTLISGFATQFWHLALARIGVGVGESGVAPSSHSLIADRFQKNRATALAIYMVGSTIGVFLALSGGGWINDVYGWRVAFYAAGLPGVVLAFIAIFLIIDRRDHEPFSKRMFQTVDDQPSLLGGIKLLWQIKAWRYGALATSITHLASMGIAAFLPSFMIRSYSLSAAETGLILAFVVGIGGAVGQIVGGILADRLSLSKGIQWLPWTMCFAFMVVSIVAPMAFLSSNLQLFQGLLLVYFLFVLSSSGIQFAIAQSVVHSDQRAMSSAALILLINLTGMGLGPLIVGLFSDLFSDTYGNESLRYAMLCMTPCFIVGIYCFYKTGVYLPDEYVEETEEERLHPAHH